RTVAANVETPCVRNVRSLLLCALAAEHLGESNRARELEAAAEEWHMEDFGGWGIEAQLRLALVRGDLDLAATYVEERIDSGAALGPDPFAALLDAYAALGLRDRIEATVPFVQGSRYLEPFALRARGIVRRDPALVSQAAARFDALGLAWHAEQTRQSL